MVFQLDGTSSAVATTESVLTVDVGTGQQTKLGSIPVSESTCCPSAVQWSTDHRRAFVSSLVLQAVVDLDTGTLQQIGPPPDGWLDQAISRHGDRIARVDEVSGTAESIVVSDLVGHELGRLTLPGIRSSKR